MAMKTATFGKAHKIKQKSRNGQAGMLGHNLRKVKTTFFPVYTKRWHFPSTYKVKPILSQYL